ncbi:sulfatase [Natrialbaceae archaeon A-gly3]
MSESTERESEPHDRVWNVVLVVLDTARATSVGERTMPTLSALGEEGTTFERAYSSAPWTLPSHASLFTGTYTSEHGAHGGNTYLSTEFRTVAEAFSEAGYETVGVSNNTWITEEFGFDRGFDDLRRGWQFLQSETDMGTVVRAEHLGWKLEAARERLFEGNPFVNAANLLYSEVIQPQGDDGADRATTWITEWLDDRDEGRPFFLFCNYLEPHVEYDPPGEYARRYLPEGTYEEATAIRQDPRAYDCEEYDLTDREFELLRGLYRAELAYVDDQLARLRRALEAADQWEDTLFVVCGDHGENVGEHDFFGHQYNLYDTLLHVPLVCHGGPFTGGTRTDLVQLLDLPGSLLEVAGIADEPFEAQSRGRSLLPDADDDPREAVIAEYVSPQPEIERLEDRFGDLPERVYEFDRQLRSIRTDEYKYVTGDGGFERLHDVREDPLERSDISSQRPEVARELRERLENRLDGLEVGTPATPVEMRESTKDRLADLGYL